MLRKSILVALSSLILLGTVSVLVQSAAGDDSFPDPSDPSWYSTSPDSSYSPDSTDTTNPSSTTPSTNDPDPVCYANKLDKGVYPAGNPRSVNKGSFDLTLSAAAQSAPAALIGGAILCGTDPSASKDGLYFLNTVIKLPNKGELVRCARPNPAVNSYCKKNPGDIADGSYVGSMLANLHCTDSDTCSGSLDQSDVSTETHVRYNTATEGGSDNRCNPASKVIVACYRTSGTVFDTATCGSDMIISKSGHKPATLTIYAPSCTNADKPLKSVYFTSIRSFTLCRYASGPNDTRCNETPSLNWLFESAPNPKKQGTFKLVQKLSDGPVLMAVSS